MKLIFLLLSFLSLFPSASNGSEEKKVIGIVTSIEMHDYLHVTVRAKGKEIAFLCLENRCPQDIYKYGEPKNNRYMGQKVEVHFRTENHYFPEAAASLRINAILQLKRLNHESR